jgi:hypothetical protein
MALCGVAASWPSAYVLVRRIVWIYPGHPDLGGVIHTEAGQNDGLMVKKKADVSRCPPICANLES